MYNAIDTMFDQHLTRFGRSLIGFEPTFRRLSTAEALDNGGYPPYNLERISDQGYRITLAVAGFTLSELDITLADNKLTVAGDTSVRKTTASGDWIHKGIAERNFTRTFVLADHVVVTNAALENGLLTIELTREIPEALKPRKIAIKNSDVIESAPTAIT